MHFKNILFLGLIAAASISHANMSIGDYNPHNTVISKYENGNQLAVIKSIPLSTYLKSIYSGYKVNFSQSDDQLISISSKDKIHNSAASILEFLSYKYGLSFTLNNKNQTVIVSKETNINYQTYKKALTDSQQKYKKSTDKILAVADDLDILLASVLSQHQKSMTDKEIDQIKQSLNNWQQLKSKLGNHYA